MNAPPSAPSTPPNAPNEPRTALSELQEIARSLRESAAMMKDQTDAAVRAVKDLSKQLGDAVKKLETEISTVDLKADANADELAKLALAPMRQRAPTLPEIVAARQAPPVAVASVAPTSGSPTGFVSISPLDEVIATTSIHAIAHAVPAARRENRLLTLAIALLVVLSEGLRLFHHT